MLRWLRILFVEQTTPDEMIVFLVVCVVLALLFAILLYALIFSLLWRTRLRQHTTLPLRKLLLPGRDQLRDYFGEYALAATTSLLLTLTIAARHDAVQTVLQYQLADISTEDVRRAFPSATVRAEDLSASDEADSVGTSYATDIVAGADGATSPDGFWKLPVNTLLVSMVQAGQADRAARWMKAAVPRLQQNPWPSFPRRGHLIAIAVSLLLGYVLWFAWQRSRSIAKSGRAAATEYLRMIGRLLAPAVCIALLLVSAAAAGNAERVASSAAAAAPLLVPASPAQPPDAPVRRIARAMERQAARTREVDRVSSLLGSVGDSVSAIQSTLTRLTLQTLALRDTTTVLRDYALLDTRAWRTELDQLSALFDRSMTSLGELRRTVDAQNNSLAQQLRRLEASISSIDALARRAAGLAAASNDSIARIRTELAGLARRLAALESRLQTLERTQPLAFVLVLTGSSYSISGTGGNTTRLSAPNTGLFALTPGTYRIVGAAESQTITVVAGRAYTVRLRDPIG